MDIGLMSAIRWCAVRNVNARAISGKSSGIIEILRHNADRYHTAGSSSVVEASLWARSRRDKIKIACYHATKEAYLAILDYLDYAASVCQFATT